MLPQNGVEGEANDDDEIMIAATGILTLVQTDAAIDYCVLTKYNWVKLDQ